MFFLDADFITKLSSALLTMNQKILTELIRNRIPFCKRDVLG